MIKILEDLLIEATTNANVPGSLVAGLRKAVDAARSAADPLPPPFDSQEEAQRAAGIWPQEAEPATVRVGYAPAPGPYRVCVKEIVTSARTIKIGEVYPGSPDRTRRPECWLPCDKDGWVASSHIGPTGLKIEWRDGAGTSDWRPARVPQVSAIDEMAEQMKRWAAPTREGFDKAIDGLSEAMGVPKRRLLGQAQEAAPALAVQEGGSHYKIMTIQPVEYIHANGLGYFEGNVVKYVSRWRAKGGLQDLKKARHYLDLLIELEGDTK